MNSTFDPALLREAPLFTASSVHTEYACFTTELGIPIDTYGVTVAPYREAQARLEEARALFQGSEKLLRVHPYLKHLEEQARPVIDAHFDAMATLDDALTDEVICVVADALEMVGVTDRATIFEACRCAIRGGEMWDGKGFTRGIDPAEVPPTVPDETLQANAPGKAETQEEWRRGDDQDTQDMNLFQSFVEDIYPDCRKFHKRTRAEFDNESHVKGCDKPLYRVFHALLGFADTLREDPTKAERMRARLPYLNGIADEQKQRRKAEKKAKKAAARVDKLKGGRP